MFVELRDGRIWGLIRTRYGIGEIFSKDQGKTWTRGEDSKLTTSTNSRFFIRRLASGKLLKVTNEGPDRSKLTAILSDDDGKTWGAGLLLDERERVSYPDGCEDAAGTIWIIYDRERKAEGEILLARITEADIAAGKLTRPASRLKMPVNRTGGVPQQ
jgi:hypothetical protein